MESANRMADTASPRKHRILDSPAPPDNHLQVHPYFLRPTAYSLYTYSNSCTSESTPRGMHTVSTVRSPTALCLTPRGT